MTKFLKILLIIFLSILTLIAILFLTYTVITKDAKLNADKLTGTGQNVIIYDDDGNDVISASLNAQKKAFQ